MHARADRGARAGRHRALFGAAGERFDPESHEAVAQQPRDGVAPGEVEVFQPGYRLGGAAILRPARVLVAG